LKRDGYILINTNHSFDTLGLGEFVAGRQHQRLCTVAATELALRHIGRPLPNVALLGGFAALSRVIRIESVCEAIRQRFNQTLAHANVAAANEAYAVVCAEMQDVRQHA
jgi:pyruvate ferredoxin oxidoreductase gamma subunit